MYANPFAPRVANRPSSGSMYQEVGVETLVAGATPHQLVGLLFDGYMEALAIARGAMRSQNHAEKGRAMGRAVRIVAEGLRGALDMKAGGALAQELSDLYDYLAVRLTYANLKNDEAALDECQRLVLPLQEAWAGIGPGGQR
jgi:flagellar secretion chaperone FliS